MHGPVRWRERGGGAFGVEELLGWRSFWGEERVEEGGDCGKGEGWLNG